MTLKASELFSVEAKDLKSKIIVRNVVQSAKENLRDILSTGKCSGYAPVATFVNYESAELFAENLEIASSIENVDERISFFNKSTAGITGVVELKLEVLEYSFEQNCYHSEEYAHEAIRNLKDFLIYGSTGVYFPIGIFKDFGESCKETVRVSKKLHEAGFSDRYFDE